MKHEPEKIYRSLLSTEKSLVAGFTGSNSRTSQSYMPFIFHDQRIYVYISHLAEHYPVFSRQSEVSILLKNSEQKDSYRKTRLTMNVIPEKASLSQVTEFFRKRFSEFEIIETLPGFQCFRLKPAKGSLITGFGSVWDIEFSAGVGPVFRQRMKNS